MSDIKMFLDIMDEDKFVVINGDLYKFKNRDYIKYLDDCLVLGLDLDIMKYGDRIELEVEVLNEEDEVSIKDKIKKFEKEIMDMIKD